MNRHSNNLRRYTLIETIAVLAVVAILAAVVISRGFAGRPSLEMETALLRANLRYAQTRAMSDTASSWSVNITASGYTLWRDGVPTTLSWPGSDSSVHNMAAGVSITAGTGNLVYDPWGNPGPDDWSITLTEDGRTSTVTVLGTTGFIE
jgi:type II secretory pathway pseudopilin PulG